MADTMIPGMSGMSGLMSLLQGQMERAAQEEPQRRADVDQRAGALDAALGQRPNADTEAAQRLFAAAKGSNESTRGGFWGALANAGNQYIAVRAEQEAMARKMAIEEALRGYEVSRNAYKDFGAGAMSSTGVLAPMLHAALDPIKNIGGVGVNRISGETVIPKGYEQFHSQVYKEAFKKFTEAQDPNAAQKAKELADWYVMSLARNKNAATGPVQPQGGLALPDREGNAAPPLAQIAGTLQPGADVSPDKLNATLAELARAEKEAVAKGDYALAGEIQKAKAAFAQAKSAQPNLPPQMSYPDVPKREMEKAAGHEQGKELVKEFTGLRDAASASSNLLMQLSVLKELYTQHDLPEGAYGEKLQGIRSGLKTLGIDVCPETDAANLAEAISGKMALLTRTADGGNLMPGAMSDFEQKILRSLVPGLNATQEGRVALIDFLGAMANVRIRLAKEANANAEKNRGIPSSDWYTRRDRILKEEQARLAVLARELSARFAGAKK